MVDDNERQGGETEVRDGEAEQVLRGGHTRSVARIKYDNLHVRECIMYLMG